MIKLFLSMIMMLTSSCMIFINNPLSMGLMILYQTLLTCLLSGMLIKTYWFSYILFLVFLGGLLVMFIYVTSIASNELFYPSLNMKIYFLMFLFFTMIYFYNQNFMLMNFTNNSDMINLFNYENLFINYNKINLNKLYNNHTFLIMIMLIIYLLITLIAVVKITNIFFGPLRSSF
nr:NADH dehydrogenase subunit 6 [Calliteara horishanella]